MIVFGWNSFSIVSHRPSEIGLPQDWDQQYMIQQRQKYFHLFWIPFFPIGQIWVLKGRDGKLYEPTIDLLRYLTSTSLGRGIPWYTFIGPILLVCGGIGFSIFSEIDSALSKRRYEAYLKETYVENKQKINEAKAGYYYKLEDEHYKSTYLKVLSATPKTVTCLWSQKSPQSYGEYAILDAFQADSSYQSFDTVVINKTTLIQSLSETSERKRIAIIPKQSPTAIQEIKYIYEPVFEKVTFGFEDGKFAYAIRNKGVPVHFDRYETLSKDERNTYTNNAQVDPNLIPMREEEGIFIFKGIFKGMEPEISGLIYFKDAEGSEFTYHLTVRGTHYYLTKYTGKPVQEEDGSNRI
ncbi:hypothetical protein QNI16_27420 [Cytophagaceae bacterium YF14B1]|uniref:Uncharacterized protein n=1 Tax=Xanthocytophaga flava TaxID=3048013 RepID=A0AAE3QVP2_9BACT|nr:hypothetical protein [Xanthocytophaga flavus]MDJ1484258.1 hypothetical protein [Xanthocytophaga flavus]